MPAPSDLGQIHHLAYVVEAIEPAAQRLNEQFGAGPFIHIPEVPIEDVTSRGEPAELVHGSAFGICNGAAIELMEVSSAAPQRVADGFAAAAQPRLQHLAFVVPAAEVEATRGRLEEGGAPEYLRLSLGADLESTMHDGSAAFGHDIEIHGESEALAGFFALIRAASEGWDGSDLLRPPPAG